MSGEGEIPQVVQVRERPRRYFADLAPVQVQFGEAIGAYEEVRRGGEVALEEEALAAFEVEVCEVVQGLLGQLVEEGRSGRRSPQGAGQVLIVMIARGLMMLRASGGENREHQV